jgi:UDP-N-acetylglucosamine 4,6-dehydratase
MSGILVTGGAGSLGREVTRQLVEDNPHQRIVIYSRDEGKQAAMREEIPEGGPDGVRYMLGDVCDTERLITAMRGCDRVVHCAAVKMIEVAEYDTLEAVRINVQGTVSVAKACVKSGVQRAVFVSSDKAVDPVSTYGITKALGEDVWIHGNVYGVTSFACVRYGNVIASNKSMFHAWQRLRDAGKPIPVTNTDATRFYWRLEKAAEFVVDTLTSGLRGCVRVPKMKGYRINDIAKLYGDTYTVGWRCPEKVHEILWSDHETTFTRNHCDSYVVYPESHPWGPCEPEGYSVDAPLSSSHVIGDFAKDFLWTPGKQS